MSKTIQIKHVVIASVVVLVVGVGVFFLARFLIAERDYSRNQQKDIAELAKAINMLGTNQNQSADFLMYSFPTQIKAYNSKIKELVAKQTK